MQHQIKIYAFPQTIFIIGCHCKNLRCWAIFTAYTTVWLIVMSSQCFFRFGNSENVWHNMKQANLQRAQVMFRLGMSFSIKTTVNHIKIVGAAETQRKQKQFSKKFSSMQLRGFTLKSETSILQLWQSPSTLFRIYGFDLAAAFSLEAMPSLH